MTWKGISVASTFPILVQSYASVRDLFNAVEVCCIEYSDLAVADNYGSIHFERRQGACVYAAVFKGYIDYDKMAPRDASIRSLTARRHQQLLRLSSRTALVMDLC